MSGPVTSEDVEPVAASAAPTTAAVEVTEPRTSMVGSLAVQRALPRRGRRTVGPWCFADLVGPVRDRGAGGIGPHPHIGLQTVTWLVEGELLHRDSVGSEQPIRPGQLNLMTAGHGVVHAEEAGGSGGLHGIQLWIAQPESTRHGSAAFEHHADLPEVGLTGGRATVLVGALDGTRSPARCDTEHVGAELRLDGWPTVVPVAGAFEHALLVVAGSLTVEGQAVPEGHLAYLPQGRTELTIDTAGPARALLLGGEPFPDELVMWWNYVGRTKEEVARAHADWTARRAERFGVVSSVLDPVDVDPPPWSAAKGPSS